MSFCGRGTFFLLFKKDDMKILLKWKLCFDLFFTFTVVFTYSEGRSKTVSFISFLFFVRGLWVYWIFVVLVRHDLKKIRQMHDCPLIVDRWLAAKWVNMRFLKKKMIERKLSTFSDIEITAALRIHHIDRIVIRVTIEQWNRTANAYVCRMIVSNGPWLLPCVREASAFLMWALLSVWLVIDGCVEK